MDRKTLAGELAAQQGNNPIRRIVRDAFAGTRLELYPPTSSAAVYLAAQDNPNVKAAGPDKLPAEAHKRLLGLYPAPARIYTFMLEENYIPPELCRYYAIPLNTTGRGRSLCGGKRPISIQNTFMKVLETAFVRRMEIILEPLMSGNQNAYQRQRRAELLLADPDAFSAPRPEMERYVVLRGRI